MKELMPGQAVLPAPEKPLKKKKKKRIKKKREMAPLPVRCLQPLPWLLLLGTQDFFNTQLN